MNSGLRNIGESTSLVQMTPFGLIESGLTSICQIVNTVQQQKTARSGVVGSTSVALEKISSNCEVNIEMIRNQSCNRGGALAVFKELSGAAAFEDDEKLKQAIGFLTNIALADFQTVQIPDITSELKIISSLAGHQESGEY